MGSDYRGPKRDYRGYRMLNATVLDEEATRIRDERMAAMDGKRRPSSVRSNAARIDFLGAKGELFAARMLDHLGETRMAASLRSMMDSNLPMATLSGPDISVNGRWIDVKATERRRRWPYFCINARKHTTLGKRSAEGSYLCCVISQCGHVVEAVMLPHASVSQFQVVGKPGRKYRKFRFGFLFFKVEEWVEFSG